MGFWPFGGGKKSRASHAPSPHTLLENKAEPATESGRRINSGASHESADMARGQPRRGPDEKPRRLSKQRVPNQSGNIPRSQTMPPTGPGLEAFNKRRGSAIEPRSYDGSDIYSHNPMSHSSIGPEEFTALPQAPTLLAKRRGYDPALTRRKSSKRKAEDYAREREIRAMSSPSPGLKRPLTYSGSGLLRRDTKQVPGDLNRRLQRPASEVSLPLPETIQESEDLENQASFKIGILAALSPRPTLTYVANPRTAAGKQPARFKPSVQEAIEEEDPGSRKRIDELADDLDAGGLRELMDRDRRRHEKKKATDRERLQRKLQRKADRQREEEFRGRQVQDPAMEPTSRQLEDTPRRSRRSFTEQAEASEDVAAQGDPSPRGKTNDPFMDPEQVRARPYQHIRNPFEDEKDVDLMQDPSDQEGEENEGPAVPVGSPVRTAAPVEIKSDRQPSQAVTISPPTSPVQRPSDRQSLSQTSGVARDLTSDIPEHGQYERRASDQSSQQVSSWTSFFKRGTRRKTSAADRGRSTPSEFSNTSRESFARKQQPPPVVVPRTFRKPDSSGVPQRTMSKFREDLPEFPISPPDSRVQSPEAMVGPSTGSAAQMARQPRPSHSGTLDGQSLATSSSNPALDRATAGSRAAQAMDVDAGSGDAAGVEIPQSLASLDSEGSWLSGKPVKRLSGGGSSHPLRQSQSSLPRPTMPGAFDVEDDDLTDDEYLNRLAPGPTGRRDSVTSAGRKASSTVIDLERERHRDPVPDVPPVPGQPPSDETWHQGIARQATVVRQPNRAKSKEGLLKEFGQDSPRQSQRSPSDRGEEDEEEDVESPGAETHGAELQQASLLRARSVEYKGHARHISAGSARLLDIRRASSVHSDAAPRSPALPASPTVVAPEGSSTAPKEA